MSEKRKVSFEEFKELRDNLKDGQILSVDFVDDIDKIESGPLEEAYMEELHEIEGYSMDFPDDIIVDDSDMEYEGERINGAENISVIK